MQVLAKNKTRKMQRHPRPSGQRKTKAIAGSKKEKKTHKKRTQEINKMDPIQSSPTEPPRTYKAPFPTVNKFNGELKQPGPQPKIITLGTSEETEPSPQ